MQPNDIPDANDYHYAAYLLRQNAAESESPWLDVIADELDAKSDEIRAASHAA